MDSSTRRLLEEFESGRISRRQLLQALGLAAAATVPARLIGQTPPAAAGRGGGGGRGNAAPRVPVARPFADTGWKTVWLDKLEYQCVDPEKAAGFYVALMNWRVRSNTSFQTSGAEVEGAPTGAQHKILLDMGEAMGGIEFRGGYTPPAAAAGGGGGGGGGGNNPPLLARFTGFAWGIDQWDPARVRAALQQRGLNPVEDNSADGSYQSFRFKDPMGFEVAVTNGNKANRRARNADGHLASPLPFEPTYWTTLYVDHISYAVSDVRKVAGFYAALLGWNNTDMAADATQVSPTFGDGGLVGGAIIRGAGGGGRATAAGGAAAAPAAPSGTINHISFGMKDWNTEVMRYEFIKRGLTPRNDFTGNLQSYHVRDAQGWDLQVGNKIGPSTWAE
jgi:predicted enzyme related to lactoylglutathione lyase